MERRNFFAVLGASIWPLVARAQSPLKQRRIAFVHTAIPADQLSETAGPFWVRRFFEALRGLGYAEGRNLVVERFSAEGRDDRFAAIAAAVVSRNPEVIVSNTNSLVRALRAANATIPIVAIVADPVRSGLVKSLARPNGNLTGVSSDVGFEVFAKALQILKETVPSATRVAYLTSRAQWNSAPMQVVHEAARQLGITLIGTHPPEVNDPALRRVFDDMAGQQLDAAVIGSDGYFLAHRALIVDLAARLRLPAMYPYRDYVELGGLMAYAPDLGELAQRLADDVHQILNGTKPGDIPMYQPTRIELVINQKTARALGLAISPTLLARADEVID